jgi:hypothetical protein
MKRSYQYLFGFVLALSVVGSSFAQDDNTSGRTHVYEFLNVPVNPRAAALGNTFVAMKNDPNTLFSNPAALISVEKRDSLQDGLLLSFGMTKHILDINEGYISFGGKIPEAEAGAFGVGVQYMSYGTFDGRDNVGQQTGEFSAGDLALTLGYAGTIPGREINYGVAIKYISSTLVSGGTTEQYSSSGIAADLGVYYENEPLQMTFGLSALNIGTQLSTYAGIQEALPFNLQFGLSKKLERLPLTLHLAFRNITRDLEGRGFFYALNDFSLGGEFNLSKVMRLRFGYENQKRRELKTPTGVGLAGFSFGLGFAFTKLNFDYSISAMGPAFSDHHRFGAAYFF